MRKQIEVSLTDFILVNGILYIDITIGKRHKWINYTESTNYAPVVEKVNVR